MAKGNSISKTFVWIIIGLAMLGLGGFGANSFSGTIRSIGTVGNQSIDVNEYARQLNAQINSLEANTGQQIPFSQVQAFGIDRNVLQNLISQHALDHEAHELGISIGDEALRDQIVQIPAFQGLDGKFDRDGYAFALKNSGLTESDFENSLREEAARSLLQGAIGSATQMPDSYVDAMMAYIGETRDFTFARLLADDMVLTAQAASPQELETFFEENKDSFMLPETKVISYVHLSPEDLIAQIEIPQEDLEAEYEARKSEFNTPELRLVERLVYLDEESATQAAANLEVGGTTFEALVQERGLGLDDVDLGDVDRESLGDAGEAVFAAKSGDVVGPLPSDLGPALFRINAILPAQHTSFEDAKTQLQGDLAADRARRMVASQSQEYDDLLAGGATLEELAAETPMKMNKIEWFDGDDTGLAAYTDFTLAAAALSADDFPEITMLDDGGIFAMRLEETLPERLPAIDEVQADLNKRWNENRANEALKAHASELLSQMQNGADFEALSLQSRQESQQPRSAQLSDTPHSLMADVFQMNVGDVQVFGEGDRLVILQLDAINPTQDNEATQAMRAQVQNKANQDLSQDLYDIYVADTVARAGQEIDQGAINAVHANFQ